MSDDFVIGYARFPSLNIQTACIEYEKWLFRFRKEEKQKWLEKYIEESKNKVTYFTKTPIPEKTMEDALKAFSRETELGFFTPEQMINNYYEREYQRVIRLSVLADSASDGFIYVSDKGIEPIARFYKED